MLVKSNNSQDDWKLAHKIFEAGERKKSRVAEN